MAAPPLTRPLPPLSLFLSLSLSRALLRLPKHKQFSPGPGNDSVTVQRLKSDYHWWSDVVLTTRPVAAPPRAVPPRPLVLSDATRASPLVQAVRDASDLRAFGEEAVVGNRQHVLLLLANTSLPATGGDDGGDGGAAAAARQRRWQRRLLAPAAPGGSGGGGGGGGAAQPIRLSGPMTWVGASPDQNPKPSGKGAGGGNDGEGDHAHQVFLSCSFARAAARLPPGAGADALRLQQLSLWRLPQGARVAAAAAAAAALPERDRGAPRELFTLLLWSFDR